MNENETQVETTTAEPQAAAAAETVQNAEPTTITGNAGAQTQDEAAAQAQAEPIVYDLKGSVPEGWQFDQAANDAFLGVIKDMGLTNEQANAISSYGYQWAQGIIDTINTERNNQIAAWGEESKKALGANFDKTVALCGAAVNHLEKSNPGLRAALNETGAGNRLEIVQAFAELGRLLESDPGKLAAAGATKNSIVNSRYPNTDFSRYR